MVVHDLSRFSRDMEVQVSVIADLENAGVKLRSVSENVDETAAGKLMRNIYGAFNQFDNDRKAERTKLGMQRAATLGRFPFKAPLGYVNVSSQNGANLIKDAVRAPLIRKAFELYGTGTQAKAHVLRIVTALGLKTQRGCGVTPQTFEKMLCNPIYCGWIVIPTWSVRERGSFEPLVSEDAMETSLLGNASHRLTMNGVSIPQEQVVPIEQVAPDVQGLRIAFVNVFGVTHADGSWTLIDAALPMTAAIIRSWAEKHYSRPPRQVVLTHGHFDHVSAAGELADHWNVPVYAHSLEFPYLTGQREYPKPNVAAGGGLMSLLSPLYPRGPVNLSSRLQELSTGPSNAHASALPGWQALHTPGHTPGHVSFFRSEDHTLLVGDAFCTTKPESFFEAALVQQPELHGPPAYFTSDWNQAAQSVRELAKLDPVIVAPGHGKPLAGPDVPAALHRLAVEFERVAVPENRKTA